MTSRRTTGAALWACALITLALPAFNAAADTLDSIKARGKMTVAVDPTFPPYEFTDSEGKVVGYTPDIMDAVGRKLGVVIDYQKMAFNGIIPGLLADSFDVEGSSLNVTSERARRVLFTVPFGKSANEVLTRADDSRIPSPSSIDSLSGLTAIVKATTTPEKLLKEFNVTLVSNGRPPIAVLSLDTVEQMISALLAKRGDFVFDDIAVLGAVMQQNVGKLRTAGELGSHAVDGVGDSSRRRASECSHQ